MAKQRFKSVYFPEADNAPRTLTLAFGVHDSRLFNNVSHASSLELRDLIGHATFQELQQSAQADGRSINAYCLRRLQARLGDPTLAERSIPLDFDGSTDLALQATFRGGAHEPLQNWYPYLEGYSPRFVTEVLRRFASSAESVLDPFAGVGTTPLVAAASGLAAFYCEVNPVLQALIAAKTSVTSLTESNQRQLQSELETAHSTFRRQISNSRPDPDIAESYQLVFGASEFFPPANLETLLRVRTALDELAREKALVATLLEIAVVASLVQASFLIRRGDLRYRTAEELETAPPRPITDLILESIATIAAGLPHQSTLTHPILLCEDARALRAVPPQKIDAVVTSPPYLNGTNYFRNTKLDLWFMRVIRTRRDLSSLRRRAVTSGINDVTTTKHQARTPRAAQHIVSKLRLSSYDRRIAQMVDGYFQDLAEIIDGIKRHLTDGAPLIVDIGDSSYGGVHVPTDVILDKLLSERGFRAVGDFTLRQRASRSGKPLRQALLVYRNEARAQYRVAEPLAPEWLRRWRTFKSSLPHQRGEFRKRNWGNTRHSLCSYQGKLKPALAHFLVNTFGAPGSVVLDPFAGVGTIGLEAALNGIVSHSFDISPAAVQIARAKLSLVNPADCECVLANLETSLSRSHSTSKDDRSEAMRIRFNGPLPRYFHSRTFSEVLSARNYFRSRPPKSSAESFVFACLLHILHGNRPYALSRRSHPITPFAPSGPSEYRALMPRLRDKVNRTLASSIPSHFVPGNVMLQDATKWWPDGIANIDAVITSPPFFDSTRFYLANWMRLWFCGWDEADFRSRPKEFVDERQKSDFTVYTSIFRQARERMRGQGVVVLHLGKSRKCDMADELAKVARPWFTKADLFVESVSHCESHGIRDKGTVTVHQYLVLQ